ncbi:hypothetical+protein [Methylocapsa aurea]|uniref:IS1096 element passenger TnpR family protein n=1 Tax=Methylocapsa aurea TaxID=663610 RepID=UPI003D187BF6
MHLSIQAAFNWWNYHLHEFRIGGLRYGDLEIEDDVWSDMDPRVRIPTKPAMHSNMNPATCSDPKPASVPI